MIRTFRFAVSGASHPEDVDRADDGRYVALVERQHDDLAPTANGAVVRVEAAVFGRPEYAVMSTRADITPGGAAVGTVERTGENATHLMGRRVVVGPEQPCGECDICRRGGAAVCPHGAVLGRTAEGALASHVVASGRWIVPIDDELEVPGPAAALLGREAAWAYAMYTRAGTAPGEPVVIVGQDVVARFIAQIAAARGNRPMVTSPTIASVAADAVLLELDERSGPTDLRAIVAGAAADAGLGALPWKVFDTGTGPHRGTALAGPRVTVTVLSECVLGGADGHRYDVAGVLAADGAVLGVAGAHPDLIPEVAAMAVRGDIDLAAAASVVGVDQIPRVADGAGAARATVVRIAG